MTEGATPMAPVVEQLGVTADDLDDADQIVSMVLICKIVNFETGETMLGTYTSAGLDWIDKWGMLAAAHKKITLLLGGTCRHDDDD